MQISFVSKYDSTFLSKIEDGLNKAEFESWDNNCQVSEVTQVLHA